MSDKTKLEPVQINDPFTAGDWLSFTVGAASQACFVEYPLDKGRERRSRWAGRTLYQLIPIMRALLDVARAHPDEFRAALAGPITIDPMPD